jgi:hypothetical protein
MCPEVGAGRIPYALWSPSEPRSGSARRVSRACSPRATSRSVQSQSGRRPGPQTCGAPRQGERRSRRPPVFGITLSLCTPRTSSSPAPLSWSPGGAAVTVAAAWPRPGDAGSRADLHPVLEALRAPVQDSSPMGAMSMPPAALAPWPPGRFIVAAVLLGWHGNERMATARAAKWVARDRAGTAVLGGIGLGGASSSGRAVGATAARSGVAVFATHPPAAGSAKD